MNALSGFVYLQFLDFLTTIAFLTHGVGEANPFVLWVIRQSPSPLSGLLMIKVFAVLLAVISMARYRGRLLRKVNFFFAALVSYNLIVLIININTPQLN